MAALQGRKQILKESQIVISWQAHDLTIIVAILALHSHSPAGYIKGVTYEDIL